MELLHKAVDLFLHLDTHLKAILETYGAWTYGLLFLTVFCETGLVVTPFLPGDSLLFAAGAFAGAGAMRLDWLIPGLFAAAVLGDNVNYAVGYLLGPKLAGGGKVPFVKQQHLDRTHAFYEKYGGKTLVMARFVPIVRTFAPFVAGVGSMRYSRFLAFSLAGGALWVLVCTLAGYFFGNLPFVQKNFSLVILAVIFVSILPAIVEILRSRRARA
ncbi:MAG: DedA family protein [Acidobacteriota bacterium]